MNRKLKRILLNGRVLLLLFFLIGSIITLAVRPLSFGIDIAGGVSIVAQTEHPVSADTMELISTSLQRRINTLGLRQVQIEGQGNDIVIVKVANVTDPREAEQIKNLIESQGVFYLEFNGVVFGTGEDIEYVGNIKIESSNRWHVPFRVSKTAAEKFAELVKGKPGWYVDMFLDPPTNSLLVVSKSVYNTMNSTAFNPQVPEQLPLLERVSKAFNIKVVPYENQTQEELLQLAEGKDKIVLVDVPKELYDELSKVSDLPVTYVDRGPNEDDVSLIKRVFGLYGPYPVSEGLTLGEASPEVEITGTASNRYEAEQEATKIATVLKSGSLPVKLKVLRTDFISPRLGESFKRQALYAGLAALVAVFLIVYFHYRKLKIALPVASTSLSEAIIILGVAALIKWDLDLPAIAGIIATIGTGVDQQIVITDELLGSGGVRKIAKRSSILKRMGRAFFVIFASAATTIAAMSFLLVYFVGTLKGFAVTTILGVLIGIFITRPAYAEIAKYLVGEE